MKKEVLFRLVLICFIVTITVFLSCQKETDLPVLTTIEVSNVKTQSAVFGGTIIENGGSEVDLRGVCWGTADNPTIENSNKQYCRGGSGSFKCNIFNLVPNTYYHVRAFAMNRAGTAYGNEVHFTTDQIEAAVVKTFIIPQYISYYDASVEIYISDNGGVPIVEKGICWSTNENPTIVNNKEIIACPYLDGGVFCWGSAYPLKPKTNYHVRAYAINWVGISYGNDLSFTTLAVPEVVTVAANEINDNSATISGNVISFGDASNSKFIEIGICYGEDKDPTIDGSTIKASTIDTGGFTCKLRYLRPHTLYYTRAYVLWDVDPVFYGGYTVYGNEVTFTTSP